MPPLQLFAPDMALFKIPLRIGTSLFRVKKTCAGGFHKSVHLGIPNRTTNPGRTIFHHKAGARVAQVRSLNNFPISDLNKQPDNTNTRQ